MYVYSNILLVYYKKQVTSNNSLHRFNPNIVYIISSYFDHYNYLWLTVTSTVPFLRQV